MRKVRKIQVLALNLLFDGDYIYGVQALCDAACDMF